MAVDYHAHERVVDCVPHSGEEHEKKDKEKRQLQNINVVVADIARHHGVYHALPACAYGKHPQLFFAEVFLAFHAITPSESGICQGTVTAEINTTMELLTLIK